MKKLNKILFSGILTAQLLLPTVLITSCSSKNNDQYIYVSNYCDCTGQTDCADAIQNLIDTNPNKTLFFKDGTYLISHPIKTYSDPTKTVSLELSGFAILKASDDFKVKRDESYVKKEWEDDYNYMVQLGVDRFNTIELGSNFYFHGGIIDGNNKACGIEITGGREVQIQNVIIKNTEIGLKIAKGVNGSGSADANIDHVSISGNNSDTSIGLWSDALDNEIKNVRTVKTHTGIKVTQSSNRFLSCQPLCRDLTTASYNTSIGFDLDKINFFIDCYSDGFHTGWDIKGRAYCYNCHAWFHTTSSKEPDIAINHQTNMYSYFFNFFVHFAVHKDESINNICLKMGDGKSATAGGKIHNIFMKNRATLLDDDSYHKCVEGMDIDY